jgi:hypothetical protein
MTFAVAPAPDAGPLVTGGFPIINVIQRPRALSQTVPTGYDPVTLDIPVLFDCWASPTRYADALQIEEDIGKLEWMYGRGPGGSVPSNANDGRPILPTVQIETVNSAGISIPLLSSNYQPQSPADPGAIKYQVTTIAWDPNPLRVPDNEQNGGCRMRQAATISLQEIVSGPHVTTPGTQIMTGKTTSYVTKTGDTFLRIAQGIGGVDPHRASAVAQSILKNNVGVQHVVRSISTPQRAGITIKITAANIRATQGG